MRELSDILADLEPPAGGLRRLRGRLDLPRSRRGTAIAVLAAAVLLAALWPQPIPNTAPDDPVFTALLEGSRPAQVTGSTAVAAQVLTSPKVLYFRVASVAAVGAPER